MFIKFALMMKHKSLKVAYLFSLVRELNNMINWLNPHFDEDFFCANFFDPIKLNYI